MRVLALLCLFVTSGCGLLVDAIANATAQDVELDAIEPSSLAGPDVQPLVLAPALNELNPSYTLPAGADTTVWGPMIKADQRRVEGGKTPLFRIDISNVVVVSTAPLTVTARVFSRDGVVYGDTRLSATPVPVDSCSFALGTDSGAHASVLSTGLTACAVDWVAQNGVPAQFDMEVTLTPAGPRQAGDTYSTTFEQVMHSDVETVYGCNGEMADALPKAVAANINYIDLKDLEFFGYGWATVEVEVSGLGAIYDADGAPVSALGFHETIPANQLVWLGAEVPEPSDAIASMQVWGTADVDFMPPMPDWLVDSIDGLAGAHTDGRPGSGFVCWMVSGAAPRDGEIYATFRARAEFSADAQ